MLAVYVLGGFFAVAAVEGMFYLVEKADKEIKGR
jgi:hypothetical protein